MSVLKQNMRATGSKTSNMGKASRPGVDPANPKPLTLGNSIRAESRERVNSSGRTDPTTKEISSTANFPASESTTSQT